MYIRTSYGPVWVNREPPYYRDWRGRQAYKYRIALRRSQPQIDAANRR
jgi:hypothetical protein